MPNLHYTAATGGFGKGEVSEQNVGRFTRCQHPTDHQEAQGSALSKVGSILLT